MDPEDDDPLVRQNDQRAAGTDSADPLAPSSDQHDDMRPEGVSAPATATDVALEQDA